MKLTDFSNDQLQIIKDAEEILIEKLWINKEWSSLFWLGCSLEPQIIGERGTQDYRGKIEISFSKNTITVCFMAPKGSILIEEDIVFQENNLIEKITKIVQAFE